MRIKISFCFKLVILILLSSNFAYAEIYEIEIRELNSKTVAQKTICNDEYKSCYLAMPLISARQGDKEESMDVVMRFEYDSLHFHFMYEREYLAASSHGPYFLHYDSTRGFESEKIELVELRLPHPDSKFDSDGIIHSPVFRLPGEVVAEVEIIVRPKPNVEAFNKNSDHKLEENPI